MGEGVACTPKGPGNIAFSDVDGHTCVGAEEGEFPELDSHVGGRARGEAEVVGEAVSWVCGCGFCGVEVSGRGAWAIAPAAHREPSKEGFKDEGE
jgi:hypothetical protein